MAISRMLQPRQQYGLGSFVKKIGRGVKKFVKSPLGKAALIGLAGFGMPGTTFGGLFGRAGIGGKAMGMLGHEGIGATLGSFFGPQTIYATSGTATGPSKFANLFKGAGKWGIGGGLATFLLSQGMGEEEVSSISQDPEKLRRFLKLYHSQTNPLKGDKEIDEWVEQNMASGGRVGLSRGTPNGIATLDVDEEIITPHDLIMEEGINIGPQVSAEKGIEGQTAGGGDRGWKAQMLAEDLAQEEYGKDFYDLSNDKQMEIYTIALDMIDSRGMASGGRIGFQGGGIFPSLDMGGSGQKNSILPRLGELGSGVSSAEQELQDLNQRLGSAQSDLGYSENGDYKGLTPVPNRPGGGKLWDLFHKGGDHIIDNSRVPFDDRLRGQPRDSSFPLGYDLQKPANSVQPFTSPGFSAGTPADFIGQTSPGGSNPLQRALGAAQGGRIGYELGAGVGEGMTPAENAPEWITRKPEWETVKRNLNEIFQEAGGLKGDGMNAVWKYVKDNDLNYEWLVQGDEIKVKEKENMAEPVNILDSMDGSNTVNINGMELLMPTEKAQGGRIGLYSGDTAQAAGIMGQLPVRQNKAGVSELDLRDTGGFIPPVGVKEKADDVPAMLSNNEFVWTADAVRAAGGGSVDKGAQILYDQMKKLESRVA